MPIRTDTLALPSRIAVKLADYPDPGVCWRWQATTDKGGYGRVGWEGKVVSVHRLVYTLVRGPIPAGMDLDHLCRIRHCANPSHLEPVVRKVNVMRAPSAMATKWAQRTECPKGHPFDETTWSGYRRCRTCYLAYQADYDRRVRGRHATD